MEKRLSKKERGDYHRQYIKEHYLIMPYKEIANNLGISVNTVISYLYTFRKNGENLQKNYGPDEIKRCSDYIKEHYPEQSVKQMTEFLNTTPARMRNYFKILKKTGEIPPDRSIGGRNSKYIMEHYFDMTRKEIAEALGISVCTVDTYIWKLRKQNKLGYKNSYTKHSKPGE